MIQLYKMAFRSLARNKRRTIFSMLALGLGLALLLLMAAFIKGELDGSRESSIRLTSGHMQVRAETYNINQSNLAWKDLIKDPDNVAEQIKALPPVNVATPRLFASGIAASGDDSLGVQIMGVDPPSEANAPYRDGLISGEFLDINDREGILIGKPLAEQFSLEPGDSLNLLISTSDGEIDEQLFTIRGIYTTNISALDKGTVLMPFTKAQTITRTENHASMIFILLDDSDHAGAVSSAIQSGEYKIFTWEEMNEMLNVIEDVYINYIFIFYLIILAITATVIINTLIMSVYERTREIGILSAIGMRSQRIMAMFFAETSILAVGGIILGLVIGGLAIWYTSQVGFYIGDMGLSASSDFIMEDTIYPKWALSDTISLSVLSFVITIIAGLFPALTAARMEPVIALRGGKK